MFRLTTDQRPKVSGSSDVQMSSKRSSKKSKGVESVEQNVIVMSDTVAPASTATVVSPAIAVPAPVVETVAAVATTSVPSVKEKKSSKKTPPVVAIVTPNGITGSFLSEQRPLIAHLPVTVADLTFDASNLLKYDPVMTEIPNAYEQGTDRLSYLEGIQEGTGVRSDEKTVAKLSVGQPVCKLPSNYSEQLMVLFQDSNRYQKLPDKTEIACFWDCHSFSSPPCAIPSHIVNETWHMYGNFCSPECAAAYLFKERADHHVQWERYALLNTLYSEDAEIPTNSPKGIRPAPPREVLRMFGGSMDISEYRALVHEKKLRADVLTPPMVSIIQTMDTKPIDFYDQNLKNVFIKNDLQHKYNAPGAQGLRLKRSKPVKSKESTVEWAMQIQQLGQN